MLTITIPASELWDEEHQEFINNKEQTLSLEHSLVSISKWESKWEKSYLSTPQKTPEEKVDYIKCMTITQNVNPNVYMGLTAENIRQIDEYINLPMTATKFRDEHTTTTNRKILTSEIIYYSMIALNIPMECQKWHLNRLMTLIRVCEIKNQPPKKRSKRTILNDRARINAARRKQLQSKG